MPLLVSLLLMPAVGAGVIAFLPSDATRLIRGAALNFVLYTMGGSVFMLVSLPVLFDTVPGHSFAMSDMAAGARDLSELAQWEASKGDPVGLDAQRRHERANHGAADREYAAGTSAPRQRVREAIVQ